LLQKAQWGVGVAIWDWLDGRLSRIREKSTSLPK
jgi:hypothetical protein